MSSRAIETNLANESSFWDKRAELGNFLSPFNHQLGMKTERNVNCRRGVDDAHRATPGERSSRDGQDIALLPDGFSQNRRRVWVEINVAVEVDHRIPATVRSLLASSMPRPTVSEYGAGSSSSAKLMAPDAQRSTPSA